MAKPTAAKPSKAERKSSHGKVRRAKLTDLPAILQLEQESFQDYRQASPASLRRSLTSKHQSFWVIDHPNRKGLSSLLVLWHFPKRTRVYDICTAPDARGHGHGYQLMLHAEKLARQQKAEWMSLEAEQQDKRLVAWYEGQGFQVVDTLRHFYHNGCDAVRMTKRL